MKKTILSALLLVSAVVYANNQNSLDNVLNNNGSVGDVTINQSNTVSNEQVESQEKIDAILKKVMQSASSVTNVEQNNHLAAIASTASEINKMNASTAQKNRLCKSDVRVGASIFGYDINFGFGTCDRIFTISQ